MRSVIFRFEDITAFSVALSETRGALPLPDGESVGDGEWILAMFEIGSKKRATAAAARGVRAAGDTHIEFERRDWDRLTAFVSARSEHMRAARPISTAPSSSSRIPIAGSEITPDPPPPSSIESSRVPLGARVLVVDDDEGTSDELRAMLADLGLLVESVATAAQAETHLRRRAFDAIVLDFHAPGMDPRAFVSALRSDPGRRAVPVLFLSSRPTSRDVVDAFASGADDFLPKPFRAPELAARIFGLLRRARLAKSPTGPGPSTPVGGAR